MRWKRPLGTFAVLLGMFSSACGEPGEPTPAPRPEARPALVTVVPRGAGGTLPVPHDRYPVGTALARVAEGGPQPLDLPLAAAGGAVPTRDRRRVLVVGKADPAEPYGIWSCSWEGTDLRRVVEVNADCGGAAELPDGRIVYARTVPGPPVFVGLRGAWALFVKRPDEKDGQRITFSGGCDVDPSVLSDGRILYASWQPTTERPGGDMFLYTVHPDGTGATRLPGPHGGSPWAVRGVQTASGDVRYERRGPGTQDEGCFRLDWRAPSAGAVPVPCDLTSDDRWTGRVQGHLSMVRDGVAYGTLLGLDAGERAQRVRLSVRLPGVVSGRPQPRRLLGEIPVAADGSFFVRVPADVPLLLETLDAEMRVVREQTTPFWVRPNETRACIGCHEDPETAPPNERPLAVLSAPADLTGEGDK